MKHPTTMRFTSCGVWTLTRVECGPSSAGILEVAKHQVLDAGLLPCSQAE